MIPFVIHGRFKAFFDYQRMNGHASGKALPQSHGASAGERKKPTSLDLLSIRPITSRAAGES